MMRLPSRAQRTVSLLPLLLVLASLAAGCVEAMTGVKDEKELQTVGIPARAEVLAIRETGLWVNDDPVLSLDVKVEPSDRPAYQATIERFWASEFDAAINYKPGSVIAVRYDPRDPTRVAMDLGPPKSARTGNPFGDNYAPQPEIGGASLLPPPPSPALYRGTADDKADQRAMIESGFLPLGVSNFSDAGAADPHQAVVQARRIGAAAVVLYGPVKDSPDAGVAPLPFRPRPVGGVAGKGSAPAADTGGAEATIGSLPPRSPTDHAAIFWAKSQRPVLGIASRPLDDQEKSRLMRNDGIVVSLVTNDSPAALAHIQQGDVIVSIDGKAILDPLAVPAFLKSIAGRKVHIGLLRNGTPLAVDVQLNPAVP
jgi:hypothetical protein